jgi:hypothetical protein
MVYWVHIISDNGETEMKDITETFTSGRLSATFIIPIEIARRHGLEQPAHIVIEETPQGILIRRLDA